jgi:polyphenol oxidase
MEMIIDREAPFYIFKSLKKYSQIKQFVTTRYGGVSQGAYESFNLGFGTDDAPEDILENRKILARSVGIPLESFVMLNQVHGTKVAVVTSDMKGQGAFDRVSAIRETDAAISNEPGVCLFVMSADCVSLLFYDPVKQAIGAAHAGWRGTVQQIASETVKKMQETYGCKPSDIRVAIGPSIGPCCYDIGAEVIDATLRHLGTTKPYIQFNEKDSLPYFNLWETNKLQLLNAGVKKSNIEVAKVCTRCDHNYYFSSRYDQGLTGRFGAGIMLNTKTPDDPANIGK